MDKNTQYYEHNSEAFFQNTVAVDMSPLHKRFLNQLPNGGSILDAGCGSGRDAKAFSDFGFTVTAFDASKDLANLASQHCGFEVAVKRFSDVTEVAAYDGIWCCASLLHVPLVEMPSTILKLWQALKPNGCLYVSFKVGHGERDHGDRRFTDANEEQLSEWFHPLERLQVHELWYTLDQRPDRNERWINALVKKTPKKLITGGNDPFLPHLSHAIAGATHIDMAVAFIKRSGLELLQTDLMIALEKHYESALQSTQIRILTSDYLDVTDPDALRSLMLLQSKGADVKIFQTQKNGDSFHLKAYLFATFESGELIQGTAFIGSSNISKMALMSGLEWNYKVSYPNDLGLLEARSRFNEIFNHSNAVTLNDEWIDNYEKNRQVNPLIFPRDSQENETEPVPTPTLIQQQALSELQSTRSIGFKRGLVVLATGLGKTWLAAFDAIQFKAKRVLFVAHREEILNQASQTFIRINPQKKVGFYTGQIRDIEVDILCASVQTLSKKQHLEKFDQQHFDYIVVDEFHHADAKTYRNLIHYFEPDFLLGLTATPDRTDQADILSLCDNNLVFTCSLAKGIDHQLLAPFHYYGILDKTVNYEEMPWRNGKFDPHDLSVKLSTQARANHVLNEWQKKSQNKTLAFCVSKSHADFMADHFSSLGINAAAVYSGSSTGRSEALEHLKTGKIQVLFSVDLFNEGVDLPSIDTVLMLRPTESKILFLQQLGRGLRLSIEKTHLVVLDFIANHKSFFHKPRALFDLHANQQALTDFAKEYQSGTFQLPKGCNVNYDLEIIEFLKNFNSSNIQKEYEALKDNLGRRPSLSEFYQSSGNLNSVRVQHGSWFQFVDVMGDLNELEKQVFSSGLRFLKELETTAMNKSFKMILLESFLDLDGLIKSPLVSELCSRSWHVLNRRHQLHSDLPKDFLKSNDSASKKWQKYWLDNPINAWCGGNQAQSDRAFFEIKNECFELKSKHSIDDTAVYETLIREVLEFRLSSYTARS